MIFPALLHSYGLTALVNHLWQSTVFVAAAWLLTLALRRNQARTRYFLWMLASAKFLVPFSILIAAGEWLHPASSAPGPGPAFVNMVGGFTQPLSASEGAAHAVALGSGASSVAGASSIAANRLDLLPIALLAIWILGTCFLLARWAWRWWSLRKVVRTASPVTLNCELPVRSTRLHLEPGVFGVLRPVLLLPEGIRERLTETQLDAIIAHELCHVRRRDNLTAIVHMLVEAVFWFYPPVWWIGTRLLEERERACDEAVLESRREPLAYAEGILNVCKSYVEAPMSCVSGVTGSDLKKRIVRIMAHQGAHRLNLGRKLLLGLVAIFMIGVPVTVGVLHAAGRQAQAAQPETGIVGTWQGTIHTPGGDLRTVTKITGTGPGDLKATLYSIDQGGQPIPATTVSFQDGVLKYSIQMIDGGYEGKMSADGKSINGTWKQGGGSFPLVLERATPETEWTIPAPPPKIPAMAADANPSFEVATIKPSKPGQPGKVFTVRGTHFMTINTTLMDMITMAYDVQQKQVVGGPDWMSSDKFDVDAVPDVPGTPDVDQLKTMLEKLLADRFALKFHRETKTMSAYVLTVGKNGPKLEKSENPGGLPGLFFRQLGVLTVVNATMANFTSLMQTAVLDRPVVDQTGLEGKWNFNLKWTPDESQFQGMGMKVPPPSDAADAPPPLFTAIQEQIGLKLEAGKAPVPVLVLDHVEQPSAN
jgi:bla regulator protein blaR1